MVYLYPKNSILSTLLTEEHDEKEQYEAHVQLQFNFTYGF